MTRIDIFTGEKYVAAGLGFDPDMYADEVEAFRATGEVSPMRACPNVRRRKSDGGFRARLTDAQKVELAERNDSGTVLRLLAAEHGVSIRTVWEAVQQGRALRKVVAP